MNIDLVYLWCDGNDPVFNNEKRYWQEKSDIIDAFENAESRYADNEELRYSLRSVMKNAPWIHKIYIITNGQVPKWLDLSKTDKIEIIDHKDIIPSENLPTFNSSVIESYVANIPNLSEHFILANDDCFINKPVKPSFFFDKNGLPVVRFLERKYTLNQLKISLYKRTLLYSRRLFYKKFLTETGNYVPHHNMDAYTKTAYNECIELFKDKFEVLRTQKFREKSIQRIIFSLYLIYQKKARLEIQTNTTNSNSLYRSINCYIYLIERIINANPTLLCINDEPGINEEYRAQIKNLYHFLFPNPQKFEKLEETDIDLDVVNKIEENYKIWKFNKIKNTIFSIKDTKNKKNKIITIFGHKINTKDVKDFMDTIYSIKDTKNKKNKIITIFGHKINTKDIKNFIQNIFSIKNVKRKNGTKHKVITILGIKLKIRIRSK